MTVLGHAQLFAVFISIQPILTQITGGADSALSPMLLVFGAGPAISNLLGGQLADRGLSAARIYTLSLLAVVLGLMTVEIDSQLPAVIFMGLFGAAAFATVAPLQPRVLA